MLPKQFEACLILSIVLLFLIVRLVPKGRLDMAYCWLWLCDGIAGLAVVIRQESWKVLLVLVGADADTFLSDVDCDDTNPAVNAAASELCDGIDNNCDGQVDEGGALDAPLWYTDGDADGYGDSSTAIGACSKPSGAAAGGGDCDDIDPARHPGALEVCDGVDNNCNGEIDEAGAGGQVAYFPDNDGDGYGQSGYAVSDCAQPNAHATLSGDCDDNDPAISPGAGELCDGAVDEDCDGLVDEDCDGLVDEDDADDALTWYPDADQDGYGAEVTGVATCTPPEDYASQSGDCNDTNPAINPGAAELCDGTNVDEDCDGMSEDDDPQIDTASLTIYYRDGDGDGYGVVALVACDQPAGYVLQTGDCDDSDPAINLGSVEVCDPNNLDEDCSGSADDNDPGVDVSTYGAYFEDVDLDGFGAPSTLVTRYDRVAGAVTRGDDCDDTRPSVYPGAAEICNNHIDEDCVPLLPTGDGMGATQVGCAVESLARAAGLPPISTFIEPLAMIPGPPGMQPASIQGVLYPIVAAGWPPMSTFGTPSTMASGSVGCGMGPCGPCGA